MPGSNNEGYTPSQISTSTAVKTGQGVLGGIFVTAASSTPTITIYNSLAGSGTKITDVFTPVAATFYRIPAAFDIGCYVVISGTVACTVLYI